MFEGKDRDELKQLEGEVSQTIARASTGATDVNVDFWQAVAQQLQVYQPRARLTDLHEEMITKLADLMEKHETRAAEEAAATRAAITDMHGMVDEDGWDAGRAAREMEQSFVSKELEETEARLDVSEEVILPDAHVVPRWSEKYHPASRSEEERARKRNCGFVSFYERRNADDARINLDNKEVG
ncbi:hypothetical protein PsorP6_014935 [Peronosclerospora sorghi]|uniref:Uncharacterized protein n=1 Tax=Peronosclerospora sorghi TaxID=230839 RepID=A0ACC0VS76_9STRA|nr:hypothetical protein PsorP6_014935 [Peronosclerospora sorghi]